MYQNNKPNTNDPPRMQIKSMFNCEVIYASTPRKFDGNECAIVCYGRVAHALSAGIKCRHCITYSNIDFVPKLFNLGHTLHFFLIFDENNWGDDYLIYWFPDPPIKVD